MLLGLKRKGNDEKLKEVKERLISGKKPQSSSGRFETRLDKSVFEPSRGGKRSYLTLNHSLLIFVSLSANKESIDLRGVYSFCPKSNISFQCAAVEMRKRILKNDLIDDYK